MRLHLPPLPPHIVPLTTDASRSLSTRYPKSSVKNPLANCVTCSGRQHFLWKGEDQEPTEYECPCGDQYLLFRWLWNCGIMPRYQRLFWSDWLDQAWFSTPGAGAIAEYLEMKDQMVSGGIGLTLFGTKGNGKTLLAHLVLKELVRDGFDVYATSFTQMIDVFAEGWSDQVTRRWFNARLRDVEVLFIDDLGRERNQGKGSVGENMLETVIRHRVACQAPTIITTNIDGDQIGAAYGGHTESLLSEVSIEARIVGSDTRDRVRKARLNEMRQGLTRPVML